MADPSLVLEAYKRFGSDPTRRPILDEIAKRNGIDPQEMQTAGSTGISMPIPQGLQGPQTPGYWNQVWTRFSGQDPKFNPQIDPVQQQKFATEHPILNGIGQVVNHPMLQDPMLLGLPSEGAGAGIAATAKRALGLGAGIGTGIGVRHIAKSAGLGETVSDLMGTAAAGLITKKLSPEDAATVEGLLKNKGVGAARSFLSKFLTPETEGTAATVKGVRPPALQGSSLERMTPPTQASVAPPPVQGSSLSRVAPEIQPVTATPPPIQGSSADWFAQPEIPPVQSATPPLQGSSLRRRAPAAVQKEAGISPVNPTQPAPSGIKPVTASESPVTVGPPGPVKGLNLTEVDPHYMPEVAEAPTAAQNLDTYLSQNYLQGKTPDEIRAMSMSEINGYRKQRTDALGMKASPLKADEFQAKRERLAVRHANLGGSPASPPTPVSSPAPIESTAPPPPVSPRSSPASPPLWKPIPLSSRAGVPQDVSPSAWVRPEDPSWNKMAPMTSQEYEINYKNLTGRQRAALSKQEYGRLLNYQMTLK